LIKKKRRCLSKKRINGSQYLVLGKLGDKSSSMRTKLRFKASEIARSKVRKEPSQITME
jgi:hypothetical protein